MSASSAPDITQLSDVQQDALQAYTNVTDQEPLAAIALLQRCEWNVQIAISRFFDGEPTSDPLAEARAAQSVPAITSRQTANLQYDALLAANPTSPLSTRSSQENVVHRIDTSSNVAPAYRPPLLLSALFTPFSILFRIFSTVLSPLSFLLPSFISRTFRNLLTTNARPSRRQLPPSDTARRFVREFEETYSPNPPLRWVETGFNLTLDNCKKDAKFLLVVLLSPSHDDTHSWVRDTLLSSQFYQFLQTHSREVVLWGGSVQDAEGYQVSTSLNCTKFPFAALICQTTEGSSGGSSRSGQMVVVARAAGLLPANELVAKLASAVTAQENQLRVMRTQRAEQQAQRGLRDEQDSAYERSLAQDRERVRRKREEEQAKEQAEKQAMQAALEGERKEEQRQQWRRWRQSQLFPEPYSTTGAVRLSIRLANGERLVRKFDAKSPLEELYAYVECHDAVGQEEAEKSSPPGYKHDFAFRLVSPLPRNVIDLDEGGTIGERVGRGGNLIVEKLDEDENGEDD